MTTGSLLVVAYAIASRLAYVGWVGVALRRQECDQYFTKRDGVEPGYRRFRRRAEWIMRNDALAIVLACIVTRDTLHLAVPRTILLAVAAILIAIGLGTKMWAARTLGDNAYYWHNFFSSDMHEPPDPPGPYRYLDNPMYTLGYLHAYGAALALGSLPGLALACFDQAAILVFHYIVEKPHYDRLVAPAR